MTTGYVTLVCVQCRIEHKTMRTHYQGKPINDWWAGRGRRCSRCIASPVPTQRFSQQIVTTPPPPPPPPPAPPAPVIPVPRPAPAPVALPVPPVPPAIPVGRLEEQFMTFHENNPRVYEALVREGRALLARGHRKLGIGMLYERLRWLHLLETFDDEYAFKLPNNYRSYYARFIMRHEPDFEGVFNLAELRSTR